MGYVYQATNKINGKRYIGHTSKSIEERIKCHCRKAEKGIDRVFYRAIRKYGIENFVVEEIFYSESKEESLEKEKVLIEETKPEYNVAIGGTGGDTFSGQPEEKKESTRKLIRKLHRDRLRLMSYDQRKLSKEQVREIRSSAMSQTELAKKYNVSRCTIHCIINKKKYRDVI